MAPGKPFQDNHHLSLSTLPADVLIQIQSFLDPEDIHSLRKTSKLLYSISKLHTVWIDAMQRVCSAHGVSLSTFHPVENISPTELENAALSPFRFVTRVETSIAVDEDMVPFLTRVIEPDLPPLVPTEGLDVPFDCDAIFLVPGGRFVFADTVNHGLALWDLGIHAGTSINTSPLAVLPKASGAIVRSISPTPDAHGVYMCIEDEMNLNTGHTCLSIYEIYPSSPAVAFRLICSLKVRGAPDPICAYRNVLACIHDDNQVTVWNFIQNAGINWECPNRPDKIMIFADSLILVETDQLTVWDIPVTLYLPIDEVEGIPLVQQVPRLKIPCPGVGSDVTPPQYLLSAPSQWVSPGSRLPFFGLCIAPEIEGDDFTMRCYTFKSSGISNNPQLQAFYPLQVGIVRSFPFSMINSLRHLRFCATPVDPGREVFSKTKNLNFTMEDADIHDFDFCPASGRLVVRTSSGDIRIVDYLSPPCDL